MNVKDVLENWFIGQGSYVKFTSIFLETIA